MNTLSQATPAHAREEPPHAAESRPARARTCSASRDQLTEEERLVRDTARDFAAERAAPHIADWFEAGTLPRELAPELGKLGMLGMHLTGYGCAGMGAVAYGIACRELEACDSGLRSLVSVQGSLAMYPIWRYGSEEQKQEWLPRMAAGEAVGCFGLTEPDQGSDPGNMRTKAIPNGAGWTLSGHEDVDHQRVGRRHRGGLGRHGGGDPGIPRAPRDRAASPPATSTRSCRCAPRSPPSCTSTT